MKRAVVAGVCLLSALGAGCRREAEVDWPVTVPDDGDGVAITVGGDDGVLVVEFRPTSTGEPVHLYDTALPIDGVDGVGRPTLVEVAGAADVVAAGPVRARQPLEPEIAGLRAYPPGPVTLELPLRHPGAIAGDAVAVELLVTYMACSDSWCKPPVTRRPIAVRIPRRFFGESGKE